MAEEKGEIRSFIAIDVSPAIIEAIKGIQARLKEKNKGIRWVRAEGIHLTLKFLGEIGSGDVEKIGDILKEVCSGLSPFELSTGSVGAFPNIKRPRVIWLGLEGELDKLNTLYLRVEKACKSLGFPEEKRDFAPHLTLGRVKERRGKKERLSDLSSCADSERELSFIVEAVYLYKSELKPHGAIYTKLKAFPLNKGKIDGGKNEQ